MHPYRAPETPAQEPGARWGATTWVKFYVRHLMSPVHRRIALIRRHAPKFSICLRCGATYVGHGACPHCHQNSSSISRMYDATYKDLSE